MARVWLLPEDAIVPVACAATDMAGARVTNLTDAIEPRDGAEPRVGDDKRQGIHRLFGTTEFCNVWCVSFLCCGSTGTGGNL